MYMGQIFLPQKRIFSTTPLASPEGFCLCHHQRALPSSPDSHCLLLQTPNEFFSLNLFRIFWEGIFLCQLGAGRRRQAPPTASNVSPCQASPIPQCVMGSRRSFSSLQPRVVKSSPEPPEREIEIGREGRVLLPATAACLSPAFSGQVISASFSKMGGRGRDWDR